MSDQTKQQIEAWAAREVDSASRAYPPAPQPMGITAVSYAEIGYRNIKLQEANEGLWRDNRRLTENARYLHWSLAAVSLLLVMSMIAVCELV